MPDDELELIKMRKMLQLQKHLLLKKAASMQAKPDFYSIFMEHLTEDGRRMFEKALEQYPTVARKVGETLGKLYYYGRIRGKLSAEIVYGIFAELGYPIRIETRIVYKKRGEVKSISELIKEED